MVEYTLGARCLSEGFGTMTFVFFTLTLIANKLLPQTKGHDLSYGWLSFGAGMAVFLPVQFHGHISTALNPAMVLGLAIAGDVDWSDCVPLICSQTIGAFLGACLMFVYYRHQFKTSPEPPPKRDAERLLRTRDDIGRTGLDFVSYSTREPSAASLGHRMNRLKLRLGHVVRRTQEGDVIYNTEDVLGHDAILAREERHHSVTVADLQHRLDVLEHPSARPRRFSESLELEKEEDEITVEMTKPQNGQPIKSEATSGEISTILEHPSHHATFSHFSDSAQGISNLASQTEDQPASNSATPNIPKAPKKNIPKDAVAACHSEDPLCCASIIADRNLKLAIFCTRPAAYDVFTNLLTEMISTFFLVIGVLFINERTEFLYDEFSDVYVHGLQGMYVGVLVGLLVLCLGGTGVAMNPARDLAPRFAHWVLPIDGKGISEWYYAWIPVMGPMIGSVAAGYLFLAMKELNKGIKDASAYHEEFQSIVTALEN